MRLRQSISVLLILLGGSFIWRTYQRWSFPILAPHLVPQFFWPPIILVGIPLIVVGINFVCFPYGLWQRQSRPFFIYTAVLLGIGCLLVLMQDNLPRVFGPGGVTYMLEMPDGKPFPIKDPYFDQLNGGFMLFASWIFGLPVWIVFLRARIRARVTAKE